MSSTLYAMSKASTNQYGIAVLKINRWAFVPIVAVALLSIYFMSTPVEPLLVAALGGGGLAFILVAGWKTGSVWYGVLFGVGIATAVMMPLFLFKNHQVAVISQMLVSCLWVMAGISLVLLILCPKFSRYLDNGI